MSNVIGGEGAPSASSGSNGGMNHGATERPLPLNERPHYKVARRMGWSVKKLRYWMRDHHLSVKTTSESEIVEALAKAGHIPRNDATRPQELARPQEVSRPQAAPGGPVVKSSAASPRATVKALECLETIEREVLLRLANDNRAQPIEVGVLLALLYLRDGSRPQDVHASAGARKVNAASAGATIKALEGLEKIEKQVLTRLADGKRAQRVEVGVLHALLYLRDENK